jgi:predicted flap endonuclease-1-like 5' DNA nuclease
MAEELRHNLLQAEEALEEARAAMSEQIAEFRVNVQTANQQSAHELRTKLNSDRIALAAKTDKMMAEIDAFLAEIRSDAAGAAEAWQLVKQLMAQETAPSAPPSAPPSTPPTAAPHAAPTEEMPAPPAAPAVMQVPAPEQPQATVLGMDPLIEIGGIGPSTQERLYAAGIKTFAELAAADPDSLREVAGAAVTRRYNVEDWIVEARQRWSE